MTGGAGFIGSHLTDALVRRGAKVRVLDDLSTGRAENLDGAISSGQVEFTTGSVRDLSLLSTLMSGCSQVFHLAASVGVARVTADPLRCLQNNVEGVQSLFHAVHAQPESPRIILFSSSEVYGKSEEVPLREESTFQFGPTHVLRWSYAAAKVLAEFHALAEYQQHGIPVTIVRCFNTSGPRQLPTYGMVIPRFFEQAMANQPITVYGDGTQTRCFSYVADVVDGVLGLADDSKSIGEIFNIGSDRETSVGELARKIRDLTGSTSEVRSVPFEEIFGKTFQEVPRRVPDLTKLDAALESRMSTGLDELLEATYRYYQATGSSEKPVTEARTPAPGVGTGNEPECTESLVDPRPDESPAQLGR